MKSKRYCYLDLIRIIACFLVIFNHTEGYIGCFDYEESSSFLSVLFQLFAGMLIKVNVPLFFMVSGTLLLNKDWTYSDALKKIVKFSLVLLGFSLVANICYSKGLYLPGFVRNFLSASVDGAGPYWYLYTYIGMLFIVVFMRYIAMKMTVRDTFFLILARLVFTGILPMLCLIMNIILDSNSYITGDFNPFLVLTDCGFYFLVGYGLDRLFDINKVKPYGVVLLVAAFFGSNILECYLTYIAGSNNVYRGYDFVMTISLFLLVKCLFTSRTVPATLEKAITLIGSLTFGIYLLDPIIGNVLKPFVQNALGGKAAPLSISCIYCILSMIVGGVLTYIYNMVKKIVKEFERNNRGNKDGEQ